MSLRYEVCLLFFLGTVAGVLGGSYCGNKNLFNYNVKYCTYGCCNIYECCSPNVALIVGLSVMGILVVATIITIVCCCVRRRGARGQVLGPGAGGGNIIVASTTNQSMATVGQPMQYGQPQPYQPGGFVQPPYNPGQPYPPPTQPYGAPMAAPMSPPDYSQAAGGQDNQGFKAY